MTDLNRKAFSGLLRLVLILGVLLFLPAWSFDYWQGWAFLLVFSIAVSAITVYLMKHDPKLLERRVRAGAAAETRRGQKVIQSFASLAFIAIIVFPAIDRRMGWSTVPGYVSVLGDGFVAIGLLIVFLVFKENTFTSGTIEVATDQTVISTGPYALVRHPMYIGALIMLVGVPVALGSWWGLLAVIPMTIVIVVRLLDEEQFLSVDLPGYTDYQTRVKYRLVPFVW